MSKKHARMAIAYDFDGTLAPGNMQEHQFLPDIGMTPKEFWAEVKELAKQHQADEVLVYMNLMLKKASASGVAVRKRDFKARGRSIALFDGVEGWFDRVNAYAKGKSVELQHVLISSGNEEIFAGTPIRKKFAQVYASKYMFDQNGVADWPALAINYTTKTQYLFRINKGAHDLSDNASVNKVVPKRERPVPFENMVFIGDGDTDIPCFRLVKDQGGLSIAVYTPGKKGGKAKAQKHMSDGRVHCAVPASYGEGSDLDRIIKAQIDAVAARHASNGLLSDWW
ncbi:haloacid dehalogenase-like hydrolase [Marilutibacter alkalisoli]|uniref:Haloacid dehalogenase-like hydrolase n=1 Tax=Marilutibacter alkalisoli TaxID=2591633 RepID=A0A514BW59_9GAMM|nr:haloacid dehalogenase-like hydrolase [Lysobacter alkalisoli]QDH71626.1 haloacid dehalogenase-like hydrolase [Lysobacter alkalisoli]